MIKYTFADGNNNKYVIKREHAVVLEYFPIKPHISSSGTYDGGEPVKKEIPFSEFDEISQLFNEARLEIESHAKTRVMKSGILTMEDEMGKITFILAPDSEILKKIEHELSMLKKQGQLID